LRGLRGEEGKEEKISRFPLLPSPRLLCLPSPLKIY